MSVPDSTHLDAIVEEVSMLQSVGPLLARRIADGILTSDDPAVHAAMLDALTRHGVLERRPVCHEPGFTHLVEVDWTEASA